MSKLAPGPHPIFMQRALGDLYAIGFKCSACGHFNQLDHFPHIARDYCCEISLCRAREVVTRKPIEDW